MKKYNEYMDRVTVSDTLHEKLKKLEKPEKKPQMWKKYGAMAAALVLVLGLGAWGLSRMDSAEIGKELAEGPVNSAPAIGEIGTTEPAIEPAPAPMPNSPGMEMMGGYEVNYGESVAYYYLPAIKYGEVENEMQADIAQPVGVSHRDLTEEELLALLGGETNLVSHLNWGEYEVGAYAMVNRDGSLWMLCVYGSKGDTGLEHFSLEVSPGQLPPTCVLYTQSEVNNIWEREVKAESYDSVNGSSRRVSFLDRGYGYRFEITGLKGGEIEELVSRLVRWVIAGDGLQFEPNVQADISVNEEANTMPYDPSASQTPAPEP